MSANSADGPATVEVVLVKAGRTKISYPAELLADDGTRVSVRAPGRARAYGTSASCGSSPGTSSRSTTGGTAGTP